MPPVSLYRSPRANSSLNSLRNVAVSRCGVGDRRRGTSLIDPSMVVTAPQPDASTRRRSARSTSLYLSSGTSTQNPSSDVHGRIFTISACVSMYPSPNNHPTTSSSSRSGVHIQVTAGAPFSSSHTAASSTASSRAVSISSVIRRNLCPALPAASGVSATSYQLPARATSDQPPLVRITVRVVIRILFLPLYALLCGRRRRNPCSPVLDGITHVSRPEQSSIEVLLEMLRLRTQWHGPITEQKSRVLIFIRHTIVRRLGTLRAPELID